MLIQLAILIACVVTAIVISNVFYRKKCDALRRQHELTALKIQNELNNELDIAQSKIASLKQTNESQHEQSIVKINEAFHSGSSMMEEMASSLTNIGEMVRSTETPINNIAETGNNALHQIDNSRKAVEKLSHSIQKMNEMSQLISSLNDGMSEVREKTQLIHNIADQADLLSLNAAIEAARAGEAGRGFGVVANDMNRLADSSAIAAREITKILSASLGDIEKITSEMSDKTDFFQETSNSIVETFSEMDSSIQSISALAGSLNIETSSAIENVKQVSDDTQTNMESLTKLLSDVSGIISGNVINDLEPNEVINHLDDYIIIDVRKPHEFNDELGHIENATLYCLQDNFKESIEHLDREANYLFVCRSGGRSSRGARIAQAMGFEKVTNMSGGMLRWKENAYPISS